MDTTPPRSPYPSDVDDEEWAFVVPYLTLMDDATPQRRYPMRELFNGLRWIVRAGDSWRMLPNDLLRAVAVGMSTDGPSAGFAGPV